VGSVLAERRFDLIHVDTVDLMASVPAPFPAPVILAHHNVESRLLEQRGAYESGALRRRYARQQARLVAMRERAWCPKTALNVCVSDEDRIELERRVGAGRYETVPNGVDTDFFRPASGAGTSGVVFVGALDWFPNADGVQFFLEDVYPRLTHAVGRVPARIVGRAPDHLRRRYESADVAFPGFVPDIRAHVQAAACYVVPLRYGSGTRLKILDAWAMGKALVSTSVGCEGLEGEDGVHLLIRDDPGDFADAVGRVLSDSDLRARLGRNGRALVEERYSWEVIGHRMIELYRELAAD
jgi:glycosyltransferase involved in cell wall biosynthesis